MNLQAHRMVQVWTFKRVIKSTQGSGMETDEAEQLDVFINQSAKLLNEN